MDELDQFWSLPAAAIPRPLKGNLSPKRKAEFSAFDERFQELN